MVGERRTIMLPSCHSDPLELTRWLREVLDPDKYDSDLTSMLEVVPTVSTLQLNPLTPVYVRADLDVPIKDDRVVDPSRLLSFGNTLTFCRERKLKPVLFGHIGRDPGNTGAPVKSALEDLYGVRVHFVKDWFDDVSETATESCIATVAKAEAGEIILLENTRKYDFETVLWDLELHQLSPALVNRLDKVTSSICPGIARNYIFDALASSNADWSSIVVPAYMERAVIADDIVEEFRAHILPARESQILIFSGLKMDKLDDLELIMKQGRVQLTLVGGALAMGLIKAKSILDGEPVSIGLAESEETKTKKYYISPGRIEQSKRILQLASGRGIRVLLPLDFILDSGIVSDTIPPNRLQFDLGPKTMSHFKSSLLDFVASRSDQQLSLYYNGVFGKFEEQRFESATKEMIDVLKGLTDMGVKTYVGGGEGLLALQKYGSISWVTYAFTSGGTILKAMSGRIISYLRSLSYHSLKSKLREESGVA